MADRSHRSRTGPGLPAALVALLALLSSAPVHAGPWFRVYAMEQYHAPNAEQQGATPPVAIVGSTSTPYGWYSWNAFSHSGYLTARQANADYTTFSYDTSREVSAGMLVDDLVFTDGTGVQKLVEYYVVLDVAGWVSYADGGGPTEVINLYAGGSLRVNTGPYNNWFPEGWPYNLSSFPSSGAFAGEAGLTLNGTYQLGPFSATTEIPTPLEIRTWVVLGPNLVGPGGNWIRGDMEMHAEFPTVTRAIVVPEGFHANSAQAGIVDGWYNPGLLAVADGGASPSTARLLQNAPNPFRGTTEIAFSIPEPGPARLRVFDVAGRLVADLASEVRERGTHRVAWDGRDSHGLPAPAGVYFYRLEHKGGVETKRMTLLR